MFRNLAALFDDGALRSPVLDFAAELISRAANLAFPIRDGIPIMLVDEARELNPDDTPSTASR